MGKYITMKLKEYEEDIAKAKKHTKERAIYDTLSDVEQMLVAYRDGRDSVDKIVWSNEYFRANKIGNPLLTIISNVKFYCELIARLEKENPKLLDEVGKVINEKGV